MKSNSTSRDDVAAAREAARTLLPFLLSSPPYTPAHLTSAELNRRRRLLHLTPDNDGQFLVTDLYPSDDDEDKAATSLQLLRELGAQVEQLSFASTESSLDSVIGKVRYRTQEEGVVMVAVELGTPSLLLLLLRLVLDGQSAERLLFENLLPLKSVPGPWYDTIESIPAPGMSGVQSENITRAKHKAGEEFVKNNISEDQPSEYITNAADFWAGVADDKEDETGKHENMTASQRPFDNQGEDGDDAYWNLYDKARHIESEAEASQDAVDTTSVDQDAIKMILGGAWRLMKHGSAKDSFGAERLFLQLAKEVIVESGFSG